MSRTLVQFNDYVSLAVMFLMLAAFLGGRSSAGETLVQERFSLATGIPFNIEIDGQPGHQALKAGIETITTIGGTSHFRGEDE